MGTDSATVKQGEAAVAAEPSGHKLKKKLGFLKSYWVAPDQKWKARLMLGGIVGLTVAEIALTAGVGLGFQAALNALVAKEATTFAVSGAATLAGLGAAAVASNGREYMTFTLGQNWRGWLTRQFKDAWLGKKSYLKLQHKKRDTQEPDQRIAETTHNVTMQTLSLGLGLFRSAVALATFSAMLWHIAPVMVGAAVVCAVGAHAATHWTGGSMRKVWKRLMDTEAKFRHALTRVRDNAKSIALSGLEPVEKATLDDEFNKIDKSRRDLYKLNWRVGLVNSLNMSGASVVPIALMAPKFFAGTATLGGLELARQVYGQFYNALSWFPQGYTEIAGWANSVNQLIDFKKDLEENKADITVKKLPAAPEASVTAEEDKVAQKPDTPTDTPTDTPPQKPPAAKEALSKAAEKPKPDASKPAPAPKQKPKAPKP